MAGHCARSVAPSVQFGNDCIMICHDGSGMSNPVIIKASAKVYAVASLRSRYASLFTGSTDTMRSFFAQPDHVGVFHYVVDCLDFMMI